MGARGPRGALRARPSFAILVTWRDGAPTFAHGRGGAPSRVADGAPVDGLGIVGQASLLRLVGMLLAEQDDEWTMGQAYFSVESMALIGAPRPEADAPPELFMAS